MSGRGKGGKGLGKGGAKRHRKVLRDNIQEITKPVIRHLARRGGVKHQRSHLRGDTWRPQDLLGERDSRCCHLHRARSPQDCYCHGCCLCSEEAGQDSLWFWRLRRRLELGLGFSIWVMFQIRGFCCNWT